MLKRKGKWGGGRWGAIKFESGAWGGGLVTLVKRRILYGLLGK